jgi:hypothetical protein
MYCIVRGVLVCIELMESIASIEYNGVISQVELLIIILYQGADQFTKKLRLGTAHHDNTVVRGKRGTATRPIR